jgi:hypothetical protein
MYIVHLVTREGYAQSFTFQGRLSADHLIREAMARDWITSATLEYVPFSLELLSRA